MSKTSSIFIRHLTVVDCAVLMPNGGVKGYSFHPSFVITGPVTADEQVVIDFSKCKHRIKEIIDDFQSGFDHKFWVIKGFSQLDFIQYTDHGSDQRVAIKTPGIRANVPYHTVKEFSTDELFDLRNERSIHLALMSIAERAFASEVTGALQAEYPGVVVTCQNSVEAFADGENVPFSYWHGLPKSSSLGCRRGLHGHRSFIEFEFRETSTSNVAEFEYVEWEDSFHNILDSISGNEYLVFVDRRNTSDISPESVTLNYVDVGGEQYIIEINRELHDVRILDTDTTIENLATWFADTYKEDLRKMMVRRIGVSEGLSKGALVWMQ